MSASRGGAGATFVATHLSAAFARMNRECVLVDMDAHFGEIEVTLGVPGDPQPRTVQDLVPVANEITDRHLEDVAWEHPQGFRVLLAPRGSDSVSGEHYRSILSALSGRCDVIVLHLPRSTDQVSKVAMELSDRILLVLNLDVLSFHGARRMLAAFGDDERFGFVVNRAGRAEIVVSDVERVFGRQPLAVLPDDRAVPAAQDRGTLLPPRGRTGRAIFKLAQTLSEDKP